MINHQTVYTTDGALLVEYIGWDIIGIFYRDGTGTISSVARKYKVIYH